MNPTGYVSDMINSIPVFGSKIQKEVAGQEHEARRHLRRGGDEMQAERQQADREYG